MTDRRPAPLIAVALLVLAPACSDTSDARSDQDTPDALRHPHRDDGGTLTGDAGDTTTGDAGGTTTGDAAGTTTLDAGTATTPDAGDTGPRYYVRTGAVGAKNGSDWANAWPQMSAIDYSLIGPGSTIYIAAGTYDALAIVKSGTVGHPITFKRATQGEHGTDSGWSGSYDGRVIIDGAGGAMGAVGIGEGGAYTGQRYITIDGATSYGIWLRNAMHGVRADRDPSNDGITLRYLEIGDSGIYKLGEDGIQGYGNSLLVEHCYIHDNDSLVTHGDGIQWGQGNDIVFRYNVIKNNGQVFMLGSHVWDSRVNDVQVYYNVIWNRGGSHYNGMTLDSNTPEPGHYVRVYNNTFDLEATDNSGYNNVFNIVSTSGTVDFKNNAVIYSNAGSVSGTSHANNGYDNSGTFAVYNIPAEPGIVSAADLGFVNVGSADYHLASSSPLIGKGVGLGLTQDFDGKPVPATPSIGAFEPSP